MANIALIIAGGSGNRMHQDIRKSALIVNEYLEYKQGVNPCRL